LASTLQKKQKSKEKEREEKIPFYFINSLSLFFPPKRTLQTSIWDFFAAALISSVTFRSSRSMAVPPRTRKKKRKVSRKKCIQEDGEDHCHPFHPIRLAWRVTCEGASTCDLAVKRP
jgi:hypothetical protein